MTRGRAIPIANENVGGVPQGAFDAPLTPNSDTDVRALMTDQMMYERPPEVERTPTWRPATKRHYFRTDPGHRQFTHRIPGVILGVYSNDRGREDGQEPAKAFYTRKYEKQYPDPAVRARHAAVREANGDRQYIVFQFIPNRFECFLETDSDVLADYIRDEIAAGRMKHVYEDARLPASMVKEATLPPHRAVAALRLQKSQEAGATP